MSEISTRSPLVDGDTRLYVIIGDPISQTQTPQALNPRFAGGGHNAILVPAHVRLDQFDDAMRGLMALQNFHGAVVTYPFKVKAMAHVDRLLPSSRHVGAINIMRRDDDGGWTGDILDGKGLVRGLEQAGIKLRERKVLLLGTGGAGSAVAFALADSGVSSMTLVDIDRARVSDVARRLKDAYPHCPAVIGPPAAAGHDLIINATPAGMKPDDALPADLGPLAPTTVVVDIVPKPETPFLKKAKVDGCRTLDYRTMADGQRNEMMRFLGM